MHTFVERVVCQVHVSLVQVLGRGSRVWLCAKSSEPISEEIAPQGVYRGNEHIQPQVKFVAVEQKCPVPCFWLNFLAMKPI